MENIQNLVEKYFDGITTLEEEQALKTYFASENIDPTLEKYRPLFQYFPAAQRQTLSESATAAIAQKIASPPVSNGTWRRSVRQWAWRAAAVVGVSGGLFWAVQHQFPQPQKPVAAATTERHFEDTEESPKQALEKAKAALELLSRKMKKGKDVTAASMEKVKKTTQVIDLQ